MVSKQYQFPKLTEAMHDKMAEWHETHNDGRCCNRYHGAIGGDVSFEIVPTSIGEFITVRCTCGATLDFDEV